MEIQGYPNYLIYPDGRVTSKRFPDRFLSKRLCGKKHNQYYTVFLSNGIVKKNIKVHRLVATHYIPNPDNKPQVDHINRNKLDNRVENLKWVTNSENQHNTKMRNNTVGHKNILPKRGSYVYKKTIRGKRCEKQFKTLKDALCYKYIFILKMRAGLV